MALKINHPKNNRKHTQKIIVVQGSCTDSSKIVSATLINKATNQPVAGQRVGNNPKAWGYLYRNLGNGSYSFSITHTASPPTTDMVNFDVALSPPGPELPTPPVVTSPTDGEEVATTFHPYGTTTANIASITFFGGANSRNGTIDQPMDPDGNWSGTVTDLAGWPGGPMNNYQLNVNNSAGVTTVNNLKLPG